MILYLVIPCYNEQEVLHETAKQLKEKNEQSMRHGKNFTEKPYCFC